MLREVFIATRPCSVAGKATLDCLESPSAAHTAFLSGGRVLSRAPGWAGSLSKARLVLPPQGLLYPPRRKGWHR